MLVHQILNSLHQWAPPTLAESYDNVGLLTGDPTAEVTGLTVSLDMTEPVLDFALQNGCNTVIAHHPIWFRERKTLVGNDYVSRTILKAVRKEINLIAVHTNLDNIRTGVNDRIADRLQLTDREFLKPKKLVSDALPPAGSGLIGTLPEKMNKHEFLEKVKALFHFHGGVIRYADAPEKETIERVAVCGGAGSFLIADALHSGADAYLTGDLTYHTFFDGENRLLLCDIGHFESEQFTIDLICDFLTEKFPTFAVPQKTVFCFPHTNPVRYF